MPLCCPTRPPLTARERQEGLNPRPGFDLTPLHQREDVPALTLSAELLQGSRASVWSGISCTVVSLLWTSLGGARGCELKEHSSEVCRFFFFWTSVYSGWVRWGMGELIRNAQFHTYTLTWARTDASVEGRRTDTREKMAVIFPLLCSFSLSTNWRSNIPVPRRLLLCSLNCKLPEEKLLKPLWWKKKKKEFRLCILSCFINTLCTLTTVTFIF